MKLCTSSFVRFRVSEILSTCDPRNVLFLKIHASEICASQGPPVVVSALKGTFSASVIGLELNQFTFAVMIWNLIQKTQLQWWANP